MKTPRLLAHDGPELVDGGCHQAMPATDARLLKNLPADSSMLKGNGR
jgi:hypothetical protein